MRSLVSLCTVALLALAACGGDRVFTADEFVREANEAGAGLVLGNPLTSTQQGVEVFDIGFADERLQATGEAHDHSELAGSLTVAGDTEGALAELERCESAVSLTCYRAANVVLYFAGDPADERLVAVAQAISALASE